MSMEIIYTYVYIQSVGGNGSDDIILNDLT